MQGLHRRRPALRQKAQVFSGGSQFERAPHLQHVITGEILPEIAVLIGGVVGGIKRHLIRCPQIVGCGPFHLAVCFHSAAALGEIPTDRSLGGIRCWNRSGKAANHRLIQLWPKLEQRKGTVQTHIKAFVPGVIEALEHPKAAIGILGAGSRPEAAATSEVVELVEQRHAQLFGKLLARQHRRLPGFDLLVPRPPIAQSFCRNRCCVTAINAIKVGVAAQVAHPRRKARDRQIPADRHRNLSGFTRRQGEFHGDRRTGMFALSAGAIVVAIGDHPVRGKGLPELGTITAGIPAAAAHQLHPFQSVWQSQTPLSFPFRHRR